jgi:hypothetical protein
MLRSIPRFIFIYHVRTSKYIGSKGSSSKAPQSATFMLWMAGIWVFEITVVTSCVRSLRSFVKIGQIFKHEMKKTEVASKSINCVRDMSLSRWWPWSLLSSVLCCAVVWYNTFTYTFMDLLSLSRYLNFLCSEMESACSSDKTINFYDNT